MTLFIIDGNAGEARELKRLIHWDNYGFSKIYTAFSLKKLEALLKDKIPDLIICDVGFLKETQTSWLHEMREKHPIVQVVATGTALTHSDYRMLFHIPVADCLEKPYRLEELESVLASCVKSRAAWQGAQKDIQSGKFWRQNQIQVQELFWKKLCLNRVPGGPEEIEEAALRVEAVLDKDSYYKMVVLTMKNQDEMWSVHGEGNCQTTLQKIVRNVIWGHENISRVINIYSRIVILVEQKEFDMVESKYNQIIQRCKEELGAEIVCYIGEPVFCEKIPDVYSQLLSYSKDDMLKYLRIVRVGSSKKEDDGKIVIPQQWGDLLYSDNPLALVEAVRNFLIPLASEGHLSEQKFRIFQQDLLQLFFSYMERKELSAHELYDNPEIYKQYKVAILSVDGMCHWVRSCTEYITVGIYGKNLATHEKLVAIMKEFVWQNMHEEITVSQIAQSAHLSPDYATKMFKKETGITIKEYIVKKRMEQAKKLLLSTNASVSDVAMEVGYDNLSYFIRSFKKCFGVTPKQFQRGKN